MSCVRIYITDIPKESQIYKGIEEYQRLSREAHTAWFDFIRDVFGTTEGYQSISRGGLIGVQLPKGELPPAGWLPSETGWRPSYNGSRKIYERFKALPHKPGAFEFKKLCGLKHVNIGFNYYSPSLEISNDDRWIVSIPVDENGNHDALPEGCTELKPSEYMKMIKGVTNNG